MVSTTARPLGAPAVLSLAALLAGTAADARAEIVETFVVGTGSATSTVQVDFANGNGYLFTVHHAGGLSGLGALHLFAQAVPGFTLEVETFPFGDLVAGIGVGTDYDYGTGDLWPVENYWHYWITDAAGAWIWAPMGAGDRLLADGSADAWVFGTDQSPQPVPGTPVLSVLALGAAWRRPGRRRAA
jgi:hypothetical protein